MKAAFRLDVFSHHVVVSRYDSANRRVIMAFCQRFVQTQVIRRSIDVVEVTPSRVYAAATADRSEVRFHVNALPELLEYLARSGFDANKLEVINHSLFCPVPATFKVNPKFSPRDNQPELITYLGQPGPQKLVTLQTGRGKTAVTLSALADINQRTVIMLKGGYIERWLKDLVGPDSHLQLDKEDVIVCRGSMQIMQLIRLAQAGRLTAKIIIVSNRTMGGWLTHYEDTDGDTSLYGIAPSEFFATIGAGVRVIDEMHQDFHLNFKLDLYTHIPKTISLSATLNSDNNTVERMYEVVFPYTMRIYNGAYKKYVDAVALMYTAIQPMTIRYMRRGMFMYSHGEFEESIMKQPKKLRTYLDMIAHSTKTFFTDIQQPGQKFLIFAASVELCGHIARLLSDLHPTLKIGKYTAEDDYAVLDESDIIVSTLLSSGTAVDIGGLRGVLMTTSIASTPANLQALGRLRELWQFPGTTPTFYYLVCRDIPKHMEYHQKKKEAFSGKVLTHTTLNLPFQL